MKKKVLTQLITGVAASGLLMAATFSHAETIVEGGGSALLDAYAAAVADDVLVINDSLVYEGGINWNKKVDIIAAPGATPTIGLGNAVGASNIYIRETGAGSRLGSNDGGQITVQMTGGITYLMRFTPDGTGIPDPFTVENVRFIDNGGVATATNAFVVIWHNTADGTPVNLNFNNVVFDADGKLGQGMRTFPNRRATDNVINFTDCQFINFDGIPAFQLQSGFGELNFERTLFQTTGLAGRAIYVINDNGNHAHSATEHWTINIEESLFEGTGVGQAIQLGSGIANADYTSLNINRSAFVDNTTVDGRNILIGPNADHTSVNITHSDLIRGGDTDDSEAFSYNVEIGSATENVTVSVLNSNLIGDIANLYNAGEATVDASVDYSLLLIRPDQDGETSGFTVGDNIVDGGTAPDFGDVAGGDFTYSNVNQEASETGTPLGSNTLFFSPPLSVDGWKAFH